MRKTSLIAASLLLAVSFGAIAKPTRGGHYHAGHGSSHKGGHYVNPRTGNHYTKRH